MGYVLTADDPFTCIDLDVKGDTAQEQKDQFAALIDYLDSYSEHSRSGKGYHVWVEGKVPQGYKRDGIEVYSDKRFIICTGNVVRHKPITERQKILDTFVGNWQKHYASQSEADLAFVTRILQMSGLAREKTNRIDYIRRTVDAAAGNLEADAAAIEHGRVCAERILANWKEKRRFTLLGDKDLLALRPPRWLVKGIVPAEGVGSIYGQSGTYKSFLALDLLAHISSRKEHWFGRKVKGAPSVYVPFEGRGGIPDRVRAWQDAHMGASTEIRFFMEPINLRSQEDRHRMIETLVHIGCAGGVLCIDTLAAAGGSFEENSSKDMGEMIAILNELQHRLGGLVLVIHHSGKVAERGMRGHSSLGAALDFAIECEHGDSGPLFRIAKQKDGESGLEFPFTTTLVHVRQDEDGDEITSRMLLPRQQLPATDLEVDAVVQQLQHGPMSQRQLIDALPHISKHKVEDAVRTLRKKGGLRTNGKKGPAARLTIAPLL